MAAWVLIAAIIGVATFLRLHRLVELPAPIHVDEAATGVFGMDISGGKMPIFGFGFTNHLNTAFLLTGFVLRLFGASVWNLRVIEVAFGVAAVLLTFLLGRSMFSWKVGIAAATLLAFNHFALALSRLGLVNQQSMTVELLAFWLLWEGFKRRSRARTALGGAAAGLGLFLYFASWIVPLLLGLFVAWALIFRRRDAIARRRLGAWSAAGFAALFLPWLAFVFIDLDTLLRRPHEVFIFSDIGFWMKFWHTDSVLGVLREQAKQLYETFTIGNDTSTQYGYDAPLFYPWVRAFFVVGLALAVLRVRRPAGAFLLLWLLPTVVIGGVLTDYATFMPRLVGMLPAAMLLAGVGLVAVTDAFAWMATGAAWLLRHLDWQERRLGFASLCFAAVFAVVMADGGTRHVHAYFDEYPTTPRVTWWPWIEPMSSIGRFIADRPDIDRVYIFKTDSVYAGHRIIQFYTYGSDVELEDISCDSTPCKIPEPVAKGVTAYVLPRGQLYLDTRVTFMEPGGQMFVFSGPVNEDDEIGEMFEAYVIDQTGSPNTPKQVEVPYSVN